MPYSEPMNLAVVACPGGERFADEVITHLKHMYKHRFTLKNDVISKRYELNKDDLVKKINFYKKSYEKALELNPKSAETSYLL